MTATSNTARLRVVPLEVSTFEPHELHRNERIWTETNCYIDMWIEVLNVFGRDPAPMAVVAFSADFLDDQWQFLKPESDDLRQLYNVDAREMNVWRPVLTHVSDKLAAGNLVTVEVDAFYLPDTAGVSYQLSHGKTTIAPNEVDVAGRRLGYFHNAGYFELSGDDFDGIFRLGAHADPDHLQPYMELIRVIGEAPSDLARRAGELARKHIARRPVDNPVERLADRIRADIRWLSQESLETFHFYAFGTLRQFGLTAELAGSAARWLAAAGEPIAPTAAEAFFAASQTAKSTQFRLARLSRGRSVDVDDALSEMAKSWAAGSQAMSAWAGR